MTGIRWALAVSALVALAACGDGESSDGALAALGVKDGASRGVSKSAEATPDKAIKLELSTGAQLEVPKGAVGKATTVTMERPADTKALDLVQRFKTAQDRIVSAPYVLKPHGTTFNAEVTVTLPLSKSGSREEVEVAWLEDEDDTEWKKLGVAKSDGRNATITLKHFSVLVVVEDASDLRQVDEPAADPDAGEPDAGASVDAGVDVEIDAGLDGGDTLPEDGGGADDFDAVVPEAGAPDAGAQLDGSTQIEPDAADQLPDAGSDAGDAGVGDASPPPDGGAVSNDFALLYYNKLESCGHIMQTGNWSIDMGPESRTACEFRCYASGTCEDALGAFCLFPIGDAEALSAETAACVAACSSFTCPDAGIATRCNEQSECANGEDERFCGGAFVCGTETIDFHLRCNSYIDCLDGSDEVGCRTCDGGWPLRDEQVCDGVSHCSDGSDEVGCAQIVQCLAPPVGI